jgi:RNA polymerase sigma-70 factor (ECF subfamily)
VKGGLAVNVETITTKLNAMRNGDKGAFEDLYSGLHTPVYTVIYRVVWDKSVSEDVLQDVFIKIYQCPPEPTVKNPRAYIFQMARNLAIDSMRKRARNIPLDETEELAHQPLDGIPLRMDIENALKTLSAQDCQIVTLHVIGELKFREISEIMKLPLGTVLWRYQKGIGKLQKLLSGGTL